MAKPPFRAIVDNHRPHQDCLIDRVGTIIPTLLWPAWQKGLSWLPRTNGWEYSFEKALECVRQGVRPLLYGWLDGQLLGTGLEMLSLGWISVAFLPTNRDLAELMAWGHIQDDITQHVVNGVVLGYPLAAVEHWIKCGCLGLTMKEMLQKARSAGSGPG